MLIAKKAFARLGDRQISILTGSHNYAFFELDNLRAITQSREPMGNGDDGKLCI